MLRNSSKIQVCGLIALILSGCSSFSPLMVEGAGHSDFHKILNIKINADPYYEYRIRSVLSVALAPYSQILSRYVVKIEIKEDSGAMAYSEKEVLKEQKRLICHLKIFDQKYNEVFQTNVDSFASYEVRDNAPFTSMSSEKQTTDLLLNDLSNNTALVIIAFLRDR